MPPFTEWTTAAVVAALVLVQVLVAAYAFVRSRSGGVDAGVPADGELDGGDDLDESDTVVCRYCGAENDPGYTFCRRCVSELGAAAATGGLRSSPRPGPPRT
jgi:hypothetical protein